MSSRIRNAYYNCARHEDKKPSFKIIDALKGYSIPVSVISSGTGHSREGTHLKKNPIMFGLSAGFVAISEFIGSSRFGKSDKLCMNAANKAWEQIALNNKNVSLKVAGQQQWLTQALSANDSTTTDLLKNKGIDVQDKASLLDLQKAYIFGVKQAFVAAETEGRKAEFGMTYDQFTVKHLAKGMAVYYQAIGRDSSGMHSGEDIKSMVLTGITAIRELQNKNVSAKKERSSDLRPGA